MKVKGKCFTNLARRQIAFKVMIVVIPSYSLILLGYLLIHPNIMSHYLPYTEYPLDKGIKKVYTYTL